MRCRHCGECPRMTTCASSVSLQLHVCAMQFRQTRQLQAFRPALHGFTQSKLSRLIGLAAGSSFKGQRSFGSRASGRLASSNKSLTSSHTTSPRAGWMTAQPRAEALLLPHCRQVLRMFMAMPEEVHCKRLSLVYLGSAAHVVDDVHRSGFSGRWSEPASRKPA